MQVPEEFPFPFPPYKIQTEFMTELYKCLENGKLGIFESPTGTGKSLSVICGSLKWLIDHNNKRKNDLNLKINELDQNIKKFEKSSDNWFTIQTEQFHLSIEKQKLEAELSVLQKHEDKKKKYQDLVKNEKNKSHEKPKAYMSKSKGHSKKENKHESDDLTQRKLNVDDDDNVDFLLVDVNSSSDSGEDEDIQVETFQNTKIFFCSRTHSQLSQFIGELKRSPYSQDVSVNVLASRQNYCINEAIRRLKHLSLINEQCLQIQKKKATVKDERDVKRSKSSRGCPFMPGNQQLLIAKTLTDIQDVEEIVEASQEIKTCGYYASRKAIVDSQLILVPYNSILHKNTRVSSGIDLRGNILIIDEAHNLLEAIERMYSASVTGRNLLHCYSQLMQYKKRFETLFSAKSVLYLSQLSFCLKKLMSVFGATSNSSPNDEVDSKQSPKLHKLEEFVITLQIDTINIFELIDFIKKSKLIHKLQGFIEQYGNNLKIHETNTKKSGVTEFLNSIKKKDTGPEEHPEEVKATENEIQSNNPLIPVLSFLECLNGHCADGRIFVIPGSTVGQGIIKYLSLNPAAHFSDVVKDARAVILAGGTMEPMSEFVDQLFLASGAESERIVKFSCDHVIPPDNIMSNIIIRGPTGVEFEFNYQNRQNVKLLDELGRVLINLCNIVPAGIVVFLPSYNYEESVYNHMQKSEILKKISAKKQIFREPKLSSQVNTILQKYAESIRNPKIPQNGSLLFSVVGGKLSEGLNFSDDLGRCIIVVGMPYPNIKSPELCEKMKYLNENVKADAGQSFYENSCMKAVNQCIGRAVRHINDYSTVILLDKRYCNKVKALPQWIQRTLIINDNFGKVIGQMAKFFSKKKK